MRRSIYRFMGISEKGFRPIKRQIRRKKQIAGQLSLVRFFFVKEMNETRHHHPSFYFLTSHSGIATNTKNPNQRI